jgi:hypothetical protein
MKKIILYVFSMMLAYLSLPRKAKEGYGTGSENTKTSTGFFL